MHFTWKVYVSELEMKISINCELVLLLFLSPMDKKWSPMLLITLETNHCSGGAEAIMCKMRVIATVRARKGAVAVYTDRTSIL